jgi:hypothetical protein
LLLFLPIDTPDGGVIAVPESLLLYWNDFLFRISLLLSEITYQLVSTFYVSLLLSAFTNAAIRVLLPSEGLAREGLVIVFKLEERIAAYFISS